MWRPWCTNEQEGHDAVEVPAAHHQDAPPLKKRTHFSAEAQKVILNVFQEVMAEGGQYNEALERTCRYTKCSASSIRRILLYGPRDRKVRKDKHNFRKLSIQHDANIVRTKIYELYQQNIVPTISSLHEALLEKDMGISCSKATLRKFILRIGFKLGKLDNRQVIMESPRIKKWRNEYLQQIKKYREQNRPIFYLDETWYDSHDVMKIGWIDKSKKCKLDAPSSRGKRIIILHIGSEDGWLEDCLLLSANNIKDCNLDYHQNMTADIFEEWFQNRVLPKLPPNSVIVMDNASYHSRQLNRVPTSADTKNTIMDFLFSHDLYFDLSYKKKELLEVLATKTFPKSYVIDQMAENNGHTVLRLPPYHCVFNPIELIWGQLKRSLRRQNSFPKFSNRMIQLIREQVDKIKNVNWANSIRHVRDIENQYELFNVPELIINLEHDSSSEDSE